MNTVRPIRRKRVALRRQEDEHSGEPRLQPPPTAVSASMPDASTAMELRFSRIHHMIAGAALVVASGFPSHARAQQLGDSAFVPVVAAPVFAPGEGPRVALDEAHVNFHRLSGRFQAFAALVRADGYAVEAHTAPFTAESLDGVGLLVIANALNPRNKDDWSIPTPSAFSTGEIAAVREWVQRGGALLLIADHMPFPGAASDLAATFGFRLNNGFAVDTTASGPLVFRRNDGSLASHPVTRGRDDREQVDSVATFTGEAFQSPDGATDLLTIPAGFISLMPQVAWEFDADTPSVDVVGWAQGSLLEFGQGRVAVFGEAAMFTAQRAGPQGAPMGMNAPVAGGNPQFVTNLIRWLTRAL
jgi:hypothetical protein